MTFRVPLSSFVDSLAGQTLTGVTLRTGALDTGASPTTPGVKIYQAQPAPNVFAGTVEWRTGALQRNATATVSGAGAGSTGGHAFTLDPGRSQDVNAPKISLQVQSLPTFGYGPKAYIDTPWEPIASGFVTWRPGWKDYPSSAFERPRFVLCADGTVLFSGLAQNATGASQGGVGSDVWIGTMPAGFAPPMTCLLDGIGQSGVRYRIDVNPDGTIHMGDSPALVSGGYLAFRGTYRLDALPSA